MGAEISLFLAEGPLILTILAILMQTMDIAGDRPPHYGEKESLSRHVGRGPVPRRASNVPSVRKKISPDT